MSLGTRLANGSAAIVSALFGALICVPLFFPPELFKPEPPEPPPDPDMLRFLRRVLGSTEDVWDQIFRSAGKTYEQPKLVLFSKGFPTACGPGLRITGPFYCHFDRKLYLDLNFFEELKSYHQAPGDFPQAYIIGHEVGHHVQNLLGILDKVQASQYINAALANPINVRLELQADCLAGMWAHHAEKVHFRLEPQDVDDALKATRALGDDRLQMQTIGTVQPESFTHGTGVQRTTWFMRGFRSGQLSQCDTFDDAEFGTSGN